jgi:hypothetical protein
MTWRWPSLFSGRSGRIWPLLALLPMAACAVTESDRIIPEMILADPSATCASDLGSYALPKAFLHIVVTQTGADPPAIKLSNNLSVETLRHIDPSLVFCLDYLASPLAHDKITIKKWPTAGTPVQTTSFLGAVSVNAMDRSAYVLEALIRAAFIAASGNPDFSFPRGGTSAVQTLADLEFDPFDPDESAAVNARLATLGFCLVLEGYTFQRRGPDVSAYCNSPRAYPWRHSLITKAYVKAEATPADTHAPGLLYRPRIPYRLEIYQRFDRRDEWKLAQTLYVDLENLSPVLALDIRRAAFAGRTANFVFDAGTLKVACVSKSSEVEGFVDIPLQISKSILALPGSILTVQVDQVKNQASLINAERQLVQLQQAYMAALTSGNYKPAQAGPANVKDYTLPDLTSKLNKALGELPGEPTAPAYGNDLFSTSVELTKICQTGAS